MVLCVVPVFGAAFGSADEAGDGFQSEGITMPAQTDDDPLGNAGYIGMVPKRFASVDIAEMDFDHGQ